MMLEIEHEGDMITNDPVALESLANSLPIYDCIVDSTVLYTTSIYFFCDYRAINWWGKVGDALWL